MKEDLLDSAIIVSTLVLGGLGYLFIIATPGIGECKVVRLTEQVMERVQALVFKLNQQAIFRDMSLEEKWQNLKPEYDTLLEGFTYGLKPKDLRSVECRCRNATNKLLTQKR